MPKKEQAVSIVSSMTKSNANIVTHHEERRDYPVHHNREPNLYPKLFLLESQMECFVFDLAQDRVHHHKQTDG